MGRVPGRHARVAAAREQRGGSRSCPAPAPGPAPAPAPGQTSPRPRPGPESPGAARPDLPARPAARAAVSAARARARALVGTRRAGAGLRGAGTGPAPEQHKPGEPRHCAGCGGGDPAGSRGSRRAGGRRGPAEICLAEPSGAGGLAGLGPCSREWAHRPRWGRLKEFPDAGPRNSASKGRAVSALFAPPTSARLCGHPGA